MNIFFFTSFILDSVHSPPLHRHNITYITHTKLHHFRNLNWTRKLNSNKLHYIFYVTTRQPEIKRKLSKSLNNISTTYKNLHNLDSLPTKLFDVTLIQPGLHLHQLKSLRRYHCTLHPYNLTFTRLVQFYFRVLHLHNLKSLSTRWLHTTLT